MKMGETLYVDMVSDDITDGELHSSGTLCTRASWVWPYGTLRRLRRRVLALHGGGYSVRGLRCPRSVHRRECRCHHSGTASVTFSSSSGGPVEVTPLRHKISAVSRSMTLICQGPHW